MGDKEKRILVLEVNPDCRALRFACDPFDEQDGMFCDKSGKWVRITEKDCAKCKSPVLAGITRAEAVEKMAKAMFEWQRPGCRGDVPIEDVWQNEKCGFENLAEAALNALLGKEED